MTPGTMRIDEPSACRVAAIVFCLAASGAPLKDVALFRGASSFFFVKSFLLFSAAVARRQWPFFLYFWLFVFFSEFLCYRSGQCRAAAFKLRATFKRRSTQSRKSLISLVIRLLFAWSLLAPVSRVG